MWLCIYLQPNIISLLDHAVCEGIPVCQPSRSYTCPSGRDNFKAVRGLEVWKICLALCLQNLFILVKKLATFRYVVGVFSSQKLKLISRGFELFSQ